MTVEQLEHQLIDELCRAARAMSPEQQRSLLADLRACRQAPSATVATLNIDFPNFVASPETGGRPDVPPEKQRSLFHYVATRAAALEDMFIGAEAAGWDMAHSIGVMADGSCALGQAFKVCPFDTLEPLLKLLRHHDPQAAAALEQPSGKLAPLIFVQFEGMNYFTRWNRDLAPGLSATDRSGAQA